MPQEVRLRAVRTTTYVSLNIFLPLKQGFCYYTPHVISVVIVVLYTI